MSTVLVMNDIVRGRPAKRGSVFCNDLIVGILYTHVLKVIAGQVPTTHADLSFINPLLKESTTFENYLGAMNIRSYLALGNESVNGHFNCCCHNGSISRCHSYKEDAVAPNDHTGLDFTYVYYYFILK